MSGEPRIPPRTDILDRTPPGTLAINVRATIAHNPALARAVGALSNVILNEGATPRRQRELVILRAGWNCRSEYEFGQHTLLARRAGVTDDEVAAVTKPLDAHPWDDEDRCLLQMADELRETFTVTKDTWNRLTSRWSHPEIIEFLLAALCYMMISGFLNVTGVQLEAGVPSWPGGPGGAG